MELKLIKKPACSACESIEKNKKTETYFCVRHSITFPIAKTPDFYVCNDFQAVTKFERTTKGEK